MKFGLAIFIPALLYLLLGSPSDYEKHDWKKGIVTSEFIYDSASFPSCHAATIAETPDGLIAAWFGGSAEANPDVCIYTSRNVNGMWTAPERAADGVINDTLRYPLWNPVLFQIPDGDLLLFYQTTNEHDDRLGLLKRSQDNGLTWSAADSLPDGFMGPEKNKPVLLDNGTLLCPSAYRKKCFCVCFNASKDFGKTWELIGPIHSSSTYTAIQATILTHKNGDLQLLCRSRNSVIPTSWSYDNGKTWSLMQSSGLPNNWSGIDAVSLQDGRHLLVYNHVATPIGARKGHRTPLNVAYSEDGKKWYAALVLEDSEISQYSYPSVIQSKDGFIHIVYTWRREKIKYVKIDPKQLKGKEIVDGKWPM